MNRKDSKFYWVSSVKGDPKVLEELDQKLGHFYSQQDGRASYQAMLNGIEEDVPKPDDFAYLILDYLIKAGNIGLLEIGCGNGRIFRQLQKMGFKGSYTGIEVAEYIIESNKQISPNANWKTGGVYAIPIVDNSVDICFSYFVIEHLVRPEKGLREMLRVIKPGGELVLIFPDFVAMGRLPSQQLGFSPTDTAAEKLKKGKIIDAILSLYDSKVRLPNALKNSNVDIGPFPLNANLICFNYPNLMSHDIDAVYIASKNEVQKWAESLGHKVSYPYGKDNELNEKVFMVIEKVK